MADGSSGTVTNLPPLVVKSGMLQRAHLVSGLRGAGIRKLSNERWLLSAGFREADEGVVLALLGRDLVGV